MAKGDLVLNYSKLRLVSLNDIVNNQNLVVVVVGVGGAKPCRRLARLGLVDVCVCVWGRQRCGPGALALRMDFVVSPEKDCWWCGRTASRWVLLLGWAGGPGGGGGVAGVLGLVFRVGGGGGFRVVLGSGVIGRRSTSTVGVFQSLIRRAPVK